MSEYPDSLAARAFDKASAVPRPGSTYRFQFHAGFTFRDASRLAPYLRALGVTHCYASPYLKARPGSTHGYDIVDHAALNPEVGSRDDYDAFCSALKDNGLGQILDTVPNHMGVATNENHWWNDVLENGPASAFGRFFDIAWNTSLRAELRDKVLLPVLGEPYGTVLEAGHLRLQFGRGAFNVAYHERTLPVSARSYRRILSHRLAELEAKIGEDSPESAEFRSLLTASRNLPDRTETDPERVEERRREKEVLKRRLDALASSSDAVRAHIDAVVAEFNGTPGDAHSFDLLDDLLEHQCYRLSYWRVAPDEINYRRFFDINELAGLRMEEPEVFDAAHEFVLGLVADGRLDGLRIDHPDGLYDPAGYFLRLQEAHLMETARRLHAADGDGRPWDEVRPALTDAVRHRLAECLRTRKWPLYVVAEKILGLDEPLVESWAVDGTSGYDYITRVNALFVDPAGEEAFSRKYHELIGDDTPFEEIVYRRKRLVLDASLSSELHMLAHRLDRLAQKTRRSRDLTFEVLRRALREVIACFHVYRGYVDDNGLSDADRTYVEQAVRGAAARNPLLGPLVFSFLRSMLLLESPEAFDEADRAEQRAFVGKFQQVTAPVTAKGIEDTAFYVYNRFASLNEVGGEPSAFGLGATDMHRWHAERHALWPNAMTPLSTHDTKRSEDVRARLNVLSEIPEEWWDAVHRWRKLNKPHRRKIDGRDVPDANEEYLLYQTLVGAWPLAPMNAEAEAEFARRIRQYMEKALHEAKEHSSWINPNAEYDAAVMEFVTLLLDRNASSAFLDDVAGFVGRVAPFGLVNSLAQTVLRLTAPGVPDTYQGTELWDFSLVDPDNRRPVDYGRRVAMLAEVDSREDHAELCREMTRDMTDSRVKLYVTSRLLRLRRDLSRLFAQGEYVALDVSGERGANVFAFARRTADDVAVVVVPRFTAKLGGASWGDTVVSLAGMEPPRTRWRDVLTGERLTLSDGGLRAAEVFAVMPVAVLVAEGE